jgi:hypothetical protein
VFSQRQFRFGCTGLSGGAPDSVRCARTSLGEQSALGTQRRCTAINHRTVRWCTGLSGGVPDCPVSHPRRSRRSREVINDVRLKFTGLSGGAPDCPVSQRSVAQRSAAQSARDVWPSQWSDGAPDCPVCTGLSGVH